MARDTFTYLHLRPVIGIVEMAVGLRAMLDEVVLHGAWIDRDVPGVSMLALYGGAVVYLLSLSCLRWRARGQPSIPRLILAASLAVLAPDRGTRMRMATLETAGARGTAVSQSTVVTSFDLPSRVWSVCGR
jgi:low temperature requirement protein LtrA